MKLKLLVPFLTLSLLFTSVSSATAKTQYKWTENVVIKIVEKIAQRNEVPPAFLKAIVRRESSFNPYDISMDDGIEGDDNWNSQNFDCAFTVDGYPHGVGLTKLTGWMYQGSPYPYCLETPDNENKNYYYSMAMQNYGDWIQMEDVSRLTNPFNPVQNLRRFLTGYALPAYELFSGLYPEESEEAIWRRVAFHWNKGLYQAYDAENTDYLELYDEYFEEYSGAPGRN